MLGLGLNIETQLWALLFVMIRIGAAFVAAPVFGAVAVPLPVRVALFRLADPLDRVRTAQGQQRITHPPTPLRKASERQAGLDARRYSPPAPDREERRQ